MSEQKQPAEVGPVELVLGPLVERSLVERLRLAAAKKWPDGHPAQPFSLFSEAADALERKSDALQRVWAERDELRDKLKNCGGNNCMGQRVSGVTQWVTEQAADARVAAERERWQKACGAIAGDLRNHDMVRLGAAKCLDAGNRA